MMRTGKKTLQAELCQVQLSFKVVINIRSIDRLFHELYIIILNFMQKYFISPQIQIQYYGTLGLDFKKNNLEVSKRDIHS